LTLLVVVNCGVIEEDDCWRDHDSGVADCKTPEAESSCPHRKQ
jgi:hypothetical protein